MNYRSPLFYGPVIAGLVAVVMVIPTDKRDIQPIRENVPVSIPKTSTPTPSPTPSVAPTKTTSPSMSPKPKVTATQKTLAKIVVSAAAPTLPPVDQSVDSTPVDNPNPEIPKDCKQMEQGLYCELVKIIPGPSEGTFSYYCNYYFKDGRYESVLVLDSAADELQEPVCANPETLPKSDEPTL